MKVVGYLQNVEHKSWQDKKFIEGDVGEKHISFWPKKDKELPKEGDYLEVEYQEKQKGNFVNLLAQDWAIQRQEPIKEPAPASGGEKATPDRWASLSPKDQIMARMNATNNATALVVARLTAGQVQGGVEQELEHWFQFVLGLLFQGTAVPLTKTDLDIAMEAALAWAEANNINPEALDKFVGGYRVSHNLTTLEVLTLLNAGKFGLSEVADDIPF